VPLKAAAFGCGFCGGAGKYPALICPRSCVIRLQGNWQRKIREGAGRWPPAASRRTGLSRSSLSALSCGMPTARCSAIFYFEEEFGRKV
jgi:hypothetical protein